MQHVDEKFQLGVGFHFVPSLAQLVQHIGIILQHRQEIGLEIGRVEEYLFLVEPFADGQFYDFVQLDPVGLQLFHIQLGGDDDFVFLEHFYHPSRGIQKGVERAAEGIETAFQPFDHVRLVDGSE